MNVSDDPRFVSFLCGDLGIADARCVEIESKWRLLPKHQDPVKKYLKKKAGARHMIDATFFDQFLDTPSLEILKAGASLRLRYKKNGSKVYLQYKGPGFRRSGVLFRSEFSSAPLMRVHREESHHDVVHFTETTVQTILQTQVPVDMADAMRRHLSARILRRISNGPILCMYQKDKFAVDLDEALFEPSVDRVFAFQIASSGLHVLSTFCEYENEIKSDGGDIYAKLRHIPDLLAFDRKLARHFNLRPERLDKYHRCAACFLPAGKKKRPSSGRASR